MHCTLLIFVFMIHISLHVSANNVSCLSFVEKLCTQARTNADQASYAMHGMLTHPGLVTDVLQGAENIAAERYCSSVNQLLSCTVNGVHDSAVCLVDEASAKIVLHQVMVALRGGLVEAFGDPRAYLSQSNNACQLMVDNFYSQSAPAVNDIAAGLSCLMTCSMKHLAMCGFGENPCPTLAGLCSTHPDIIECARRCQAPEDLIEQCIHTSPTLRMNAHIPTKEMMDCADNCVRDHIKSYPQLTGLCIEHPEIGKCLEKCEYPQYLVQCHMSAKCANHSALELPLDTLEGVCALLNFTMDCTLPLLAQYEYEIPDAKKGILDLQQHADFKNVSPECNKTANDLVVQLEILASRAVADTEPFGAMPTDEMPVTPLGFMRHPLYLTQTVPEHNTTVTAYTACATSSVVSVYMFLILLASWYV